MSRFTVKMILVLLIAIAAPGLSGCIAASTTTCDAACGGISIGGIGLI